MTTRLAAAPARLTSLGGPVGVGALAGAAVGVIALLDPNEPGHYPTCPVLAVAGEFCPGCGSLRAVHALAHGDLPAALGLNVLTVLSVVVLTAAWVLWLRRAWTGAPRRVVVPAPAIWALLVVVLVFAVVRNLPMGAALAP